MEGLRLDWKDSRLRRVNDYAISEAISGIMPYFIAAYHPVATRDPRAVFISNYHGAV